MGEEPLLGTGILFAGATTCLGLTTSSFVYEDSYKKEDEQKAYGSMIAIPVVVTAVSSITSAMINNAGAEVISYKDTENYLNSLSMEDLENAMNYDFNSLNNDNIDKVKVKTR